MSNNHNFHKKQYITDIFPSINNLRQWRWSIRGCNFSCRGNYSLVVPNGVVKEALTLWIIDKSSLSITNVKKIQKSRIIGSVNRQRPLNYLNLQIL